MPFHIETPQIEKAPEKFGAFAHPDRGAPHMLMRITPHKSLTPEGFVWFVGATAALIALPLFGILGTAVFWALLPFLLAAIWAIWAALKRSWRDKEIAETLILWPDHIRVERKEPRKETKIWEANPYWVRLTLHKTGGPVPNYLTLRGDKATREIELGAFLTPIERVKLKFALEEALAQAKA